MRFTQPTEVGTEERLYERKRFAIRPAGEK